MHEKYNQLRNGRPRRIVEALIVTTSKPIWEKIVGAGLGEDEISKRKSELAIQKAELGATTVREGIARKDADLQRFGEAMVIKALLDANAEPNDLIVQEAVTNVVVALPIQSVAGNPYISPPAAGTVDSMLASSAANSVTVTDEVREPLRPRDFEDI